MEDLVAGFKISEDHGVGVDSPHPRFSDYKSRKYAENSQNKRRNQFLENQKDKRQDQFMLARGIALNKDDEETERENRRRQYNNTRYKDQLMLSEWMVAEPENFEAEWLLVPCPQGRRTLVVSANGVTTAYTKAGRFMKQFPSSLPGGHRSWKKDYCLLDCVFSEIDGAFFVLDIMCWKQQPYYDSEAEFRFFWIKAKLEEHPELTEKCPTSNPYPFHNLPVSKCSKKDLELFMKQEFSFKTKLDGLLFYHKEAHYWRGEQTALVEWLKPFMLPEILGVPVPESYMEGHVNETAADFRDSFDQDRKDREKTGGKNVLKDGETMNVEQA